LAVRIIKITLTKEDFRSSDGQLISYILLMEVLIVKIKLAIRWISSKFKILLC